MNYKYQRIDWRDMALDAYGYGFSPKGWAKFKIGETVMFQNQQVTIVGYDMARDMAADRYILRYQVRLNPSTYSKMGYSVSYIAVADYGELRSAEEPNEIMKGCL